MQTAAPLAGPRSRRTWRLASALGLLVAIGCGDTAEQSYGLGELTWGPASNTLFKPPASGVGIIGDWYPCEDSNCDETDDDGIRLTEDGQVLSVEINRDGKVCVQEDLGVSYKPRGNGVEIEVPDFAGGGMLYFELIAEDRAKGIYDGEEQTFKRIDAVDDPDCDSNVVLVEDAPPQATGGVRGP